MRSIMVAVAQWQSAALWQQRLRVRSPSATPCFRLSTVRRTTTFSAERIHHQSLLPFREKIEPICFLREPELIGDQDRVRDLVISTAMRLVGFPAVVYRGPAKGCDPEYGFDCSGFIMYTLRTVQQEVSGLCVPDDMRHANEMFDRLGVAVHDAERRAGDLVFYTHRGYTITHVGIYLGEARDGRHYMVHSPGIDASRVKVSRLFQERLFSEDPLQLYGHNPVGYKRLTTASGDKRWPYTPI